MATSPAIPTDAIETITSNPGEDAVDAFLRAFTADAEKPSESDEDDNKKKAPAPKDDDEAPTEETPEGDEESDEGEEPTDDESDEETPKEDKDGSRKRVVLEPDAEAFVKHKIDGKDVEIPVKDLTRLYGQEAALTRKSQEAAEARKAVDEQGTKYQTGLQSLLDRAVDRFKPYADINFLALAKDPSFSAEDLASLQKAATEAYEEVTYLSTKIDETVKANEQVRQTNLVKAAADTWKTLADPEKGIEGWSEPLYNEMRTYAKASGIPARTVDELVDPIALKIIHKAMMFDKAKSAEKTAAVKTVKVDKEPKRIIKSTSDAVISKSKGKGADAPMAKLAATGSVDDAADVFLALMKSN